MYLDDVYKTDDAVLQYVKEASVKSNSDRDGGYLGQSSRTYGKADMLYANILCWIRVDYIDIGIFQIWLPV